MEKIVLKLTIILSITILSFQASSQGISKLRNPTYKFYFDSLKQMEYPYKFPIFGKQAYKRGYDLPYAWGISGIYFTQTQEIIIDKTLIGFNGSDKVDFSSFIKFGPTIAQTNAYTIRPDIWILPFLNLYGIFGGGTTQTDVALLQPIGFETSQRFAVSSYGVGITLAGTIGPFWLAWDNNYNAADVEVVVQPVPAFNSSLRIGHTFMEPNRPDKTLSVWVGTFYQTIQNDTEGSIPLMDIFPNLENQAIIDGLNNWAESLPPPQRIIAEQIINKIEEISNGIDSDNAIIDYKLDKRVAAPFNIILGAQYQFNKRWILRSEVGVFGKRSQFLLNLNYRFPGFKKI